jgi:ATP-dependent Clp protease ATP-binding subunit ClpC
VIQKNLTASDKAQLDYPALRDRLMEMLRHHFRPEFLNRVDEVVVFRALGREEIRQIVELQLDRVVHTAALQDVDVEFDQSLVDHLAEVGYDPEFGARMLKRKIRQEVESQLATAILKGEVAPGAHVRMRYDTAEKQVKIERAPEEKAPPTKPAPEKVAA